MEMKSSSVGHWLETKYINANKVMLDDIVVISQLETKTREK